MITVKQRNVLEKYLNEDRIKKLENLGFKHVSAFISLILNTSYSDSKECSINILSERITTKSEITDIEKIVNDNRKYYHAVTDEYCSVESAYSIPNYSKNIYRLKQSWFKGMSNIPTSRYITVLEDGSIYPGDYNILMDLGIYSIPGFMNYLRNNSFQSENNAAR